MPTPGLSLVGFMSDQQQALNHLKVPCVPDPAKTDAGLVSDWQSAQVKLGKPMARAGRPNMTSILNSDPHLQQLLQIPWAAAYLLPQLAQGGSFQMIEIDPLLAYQHTIDTARSKNRASNISKPPTRDELMQVCLPLTHPNDGVHISGQGQSFGHKSIIVKSRSLNLQLVAEGALIPDAWGIQLAWALPFVHVTRFNGRCYLHNGYHRALQIRKAGALEIPCFFRDAVSAEDAGIQPPSTFDLQLMESPNPPTIGHYAKGRALKIQLRASTRVIQIGWSQHIMFDE
jgi:hypothetical protein